MYLSIKVNKLALFTNKNDRNKLKNPLKLLLFPDTKIVENAA